MLILGAGVLGLLTGLHAATWGAYKDAPFEGFRWRSYLRSVMVGVTVAVAVAVTSTLESSHSAVILVGLFYTLERLSTEWWKTFVRNDDQDAYSIPMRLGYRGRPVDSNVVRYTVGGAIACGLVIVCSLVSSVQSALPTAPAWGIVLIGGVGGWLTALGGAWKDAPIEGFSGWKFLRSPVVATAWAAPLSSITQDWMVLTLASGGFAVASIETYKTFLTGGRPPGKFADKPVRFRLVRARPVLAGMHAGLWGALALALGTRLQLPPRGFTGPDILGPSPQLALVTVAALSALASALVLGGHLRTPSALGAQTDEPVGPSHPPMRTQAEAAADHE